MTKPGPALARRAAVLLVVLAASAAPTGTAGAAEPVPPTVPPTSSATPDTGLPGVSVTSTVPPTSSATPDTGLPGVSVTSTVPPTSAALATPEPAAAPRPVLGVEPASQTVDVGAAARFTASITPPPAEGTPVTITWQTAASPSGPWTDLGRDGATLVSTATVGMDGQRFRAVADTAEGPSASPAALLHVREAPRPSGTPLPTSEAPSCPATVGSGPGPACPEPAPPASSLPATPSPLALTPAPAATAVGAPFGTVALATTRPDDVQTATVHNLEPGSLVRVSLVPDGIDLGAQRVGPDGTATVTFTMARVSPGTHSVRWTPS